MKNSKEKQIRTLKTVLPYIFERIRVIWKISRSKSQNIQWMSFDDLKKLCILGQSSLQYYSSTVFCWGLTYPTNSHAIFANNLTWTIFACLKMRCFDCCWTKNQLSGYGLKLQPLYIGCLATLVKVRAANVK